MGFCGIMLWDALVYGVSPQLVLGFIIEKLCGKGLKLGRLFFLIEALLVYNLKLVSNVQHSGLTVTNIIKFSPPLVLLLSVNKESCYRIKFNEILIKMPAGLFCRY